MKATLVTIHVAKVTFYGFASLGTEALDLSVHIYGRRVVDAVMNEGPRAAELF